MSQGRTANPSIHAGGFQPPVIFAVHLKLNIELRREGKLVRKRCCLFRQAHELVYHVVRLSVTTERTCFLSNFYCYDNLTIRQLVNLRAGRFGAPATGDDTWIKGSGTDRSS